MATVFADNRVYAAAAARNNSRKVAIYKRKIARLKRYAKELVYVNAALCDYISQLQEMVLIASQERKFLLGKLYQHRAQFECENVPQQISSTPRQNSIDISPQHSMESNSSVVRKVMPSKKKISSDNNEPVKSSSKSKKSSISRPKKVMQLIPLDSNGRPVFPIVLGGLTVHSLGEVISDRPQYHTEEFIYPVGYCSTRVYGSITDPEKKCIYTCKVLDGGPAPRFEIVADNDMNTPIVGSSASECHAMLLHHINLAAGFEVIETRGRGPEFFGFSHPSILNLVQSSPGTRKCSSYKWSKFEVNKTGEPLPEETEPSLSFESLQRLLALAKKRHMKVLVKEEPPDPLLSSSSNATLRDLLMS